jgi:hypothetical protein
VDTVYGWVDSALFDLRVNSPIIEELAGQASPIRAFPTGLIAGTYDQWWSLTIHSAPFGFKTLCPFDDVAQALTPSGWPALMEGENDGVVNLSSQKAGTPFPQSDFPSMAHTRALLPLGFLGPFAPSDTGVAQRVIDLLNTTYLSQLQYVCLPIGQACGQ